MIENTAIGRKAMLHATTAERCICLGSYAGEDITDESYLFRFTTQGDLVGGSPHEYVEFSATMTESEWRVVHAVVRRALLSGNIKEVV